MKFITSEKIERHITKHGISKTLQKYWRHRLAPGFTVADWIKIGEFYGLYPKSAK